MRAWTIASCSGLFMVTTYIAFHYDATVRNRANAYSLHPYLQEIIVVPSIFDLFRLDTYIHQDGVIQSVAYDLSGQN